VKGPECGGTSPGQQPALEWLFDFYVFLARYAAVVGPDEKSYTKMKKIIIIIKTIIAQFNKLLIPWP